MHKQNTERDDALFPFSESPLVSWRFSSEDEKNRKYARPKPQKMKRAHTNVKVRKEHWTRHEKPTSSSKNFWAYWYQPHHQKKTCSSHGWTTKLKKQTIRKKLPISRSVKRSSVLAISYQTNCFANRLCVTTNQFQVTISSTAKRFSRIWKRAY